MRTEAQKAAFPAAFDDKELGPVAKAVLAIDGKRVLTIFKAGVAGLLVGAAAVSLRRFPVVTSAVKLVSAKAVCLLRAVALAAFATVTGPTACMLLERLLTRVLDWGVPTLAIGFVLSGLKGPREPSDEKPGGQRGCSARTSLSASTDGVHSLSA